MMRPDPDYQSLYHNHYDQANYGRSLAGRIMAKGHELLEKEFDRDVYFPRVLEVGTGTGQHVKFVRHRFDSYHMTDRHSEMLQLAREGLDPATRQRIVVEIQDAGKLTYPDASFDRLIATHVLEHLLNPVDVMKEWFRVVRPGGVISIVLPCDPGMLWRFGRYFGPRRTATKAGMEYDYVMAIEHVNPIFNLVVFIRYYFERRNLREIWYPARLPFPDMNLLYICNIVR
jgi:ubiquinone/menaquinone biosynthesis C-methylase UbiE